ncbi:MAG: hypothetical protein ACC662_09505, partial [Planctomycetota bacterium]
ETGAVVIRATAPDGTVPEGAEVGYVYLGQTRLLYAGKDGSRAFSDAPLGDLVIVARAPGYEEVRTRRPILAGVPAEGRLVLHRTRD